jgi:hypothetical protein
MSVNERPLRFAPALASKLLLLLPTNGGIALDSPVKLDISCPVLLLKYHSWFDSTECAHRSCSQLGSSVAHGTNITLRETTPTNVWFSHSHARPKPVLAIGWFPKENGAKSGVVRCFRTAARPFQRSSLRLRRCHR